MAGNWCEPSSSFRCVCPQFSSSSSRQPTAGELQAGPGAPHRDASPADHLIPDLVKGSGFSGFHQSWPPQPIESRRGANLLFI